MRFLLALLFVAGCALAPSRAPDDRVVSTLHVTNQSGEFVDITLVENGWKLPSVFTRQTCIKIYASDVVGRDLYSLEFRINRSDSFVTPLVNLGAYSWAINIGAYPNGRHIDAQSIRPATRCDIV